MAKEMLKEEIITGRVLPCMGAQEVYEMREEFKKYKTAFHMEPLDLERWHCSTLQADMQRL
jgi:hypothetical protein